MDVCRNFKDVYKIKSVFTIQNTDEVDEDEEEEQENEESYYQDEEDLSEENENDSREYISFGE